MKSITLTTHFSCAHFYHQQKWNEKQNRETFGKCFDPFGHGHDYKLQVQFERHQEESPFELKNTLSDMLSALKEKVDHKHINHILPEFKDKVPTTENLAHYFLGELSKLSAPRKIQGLKLFETPDIWVELTN